MLADHDQMCKNTSTPTLYAMQWIDWINDSKKQQAARVNVPQFWRDQFELQSAEGTSWPLNVRSLHSQLAKLALETFGCAVYSRDKLEKLSEVQSLLLRSVKSEFKVAAHVPVGVLWLTSREFMFWLACSMPVVGIRVLYERACLINATVCANLRRKEVVQRLNEVCNIDVGFSFVAWDSSKFRETTMVGLTVLVPIDGGADDQDLPAGSEE